MAKLEDGVIFFFKSEDKGTTILTSAKELVLCKHCKHYFTEDIWTDMNGVSKLIEKDASFCKRWKCFTTEPEGFCYLGEKGE